MSAVACSKKPMSPEEALLEKEDREMMSVVPDGFLMCIGDMVREYESAENPRKQVAIIADQNLVPAYLVARVLRDAGVRPMILAPMCYSPEERKALSAKGREAKARKKQEAEHFEAVVESAAEAVESKPKKLPPAKVPSSPEFVLDEEHEKPVAPKKQETVFFSVQDLIDALGNLPKDTKTNLRRIHLNQTLTAGGNSVGEVFLS